VNVQLVFYLKKKSKQENLTKLQLFQSATGTRMVRKYICPTTPERALWTETSASAPSQIHRQQYDPK